MIFRFLSNLAFKPQHCFSPKQLLSWLCCNTSNTKQNKSIRLTCGTVSSDYLAFLRADANTYLQCCVGRLVFSTSRFILSKKLFTFFPLQEVLLKRAADLVEALYGMPHNNQASSSSAFFSHTCMFSYAQYSN